MIRDLQGGIRIKAIGAAKRISPSCGNILQRTPFHTGMWQKRHSKVYVAISLRGYVICFAVAISLTSKEANHSDHWWALLSPNAYLPSSLMHILNGQFSRLRRRLCNFFCSGNFFEVQGSQQQRPLHLVGLVVVVEVLRSIVPKPQVL